MGLKEAVNQIAEFSGINSIGRVGRLAITGIGAMANNPGAKEALPQAKQAVTRRDFLKFGVWTVLSLVGTRALAACGVRDGQTPPAGEVPSPTANPEAKPTADTSLTVEAPSLPQETGYINADLNLEVPAVPGVPDAEGQFQKIEFSFGTLPEVAPDSQAVLAASVNPDTYSGDKKVSAPTNLVRGTYNLIPVATAEGLLGTQSNGFTACAVPEQISRRNDQDQLEVLRLDPNSKGEHWRYFSASGAEQFIPKTVSRPGNLAYLAVSRNLEDNGVTYFISVDESGRVSRYAKAVVEKNADGQIPALDWQSAEGKWQTRGHEALTADHVTDLKANQEAGKTIWSEAVDPVLGTKRLEQYAFTDAQEAVHVYPAERIAWMPLQAEGVFQPGQNGEEVYGLTMLLAPDGAPEFVRAKGQTEWQAAEKLDLPNGGRLFGAAVLYNGELVKRMFVLLGNIAAGVNEVLNENGRDVAVLREGLRYVWGENGWGKELPESLMKIAEILGEKVKIVSADSNSWTIEGLEDIVVFNEDGTGRISGIDFHYQDTVSALENGNFRITGWEFHYDEAQDKFIKSTVNEVAQFDGKDKERAPKFNPDDTELMFAHRREIAAINNDAGFFLTMTADGEPITDLADFTPDNYKIRFSQTNYNLLSLAPNPQRNHDPYFYFNNKETAFPYRVRTEGMIYINGVSLALPTVILDSDKSSADGSGAGRIISNYCLVADDVYSEYLGKFSEIWRFGALIQNGNATGGAVGEFAGKQNQEFTSQVERLGQYDPLPAGIEKVFFYLIYYYKD